MIMRTRLTSILLLSAVLLSRLAAQTATDDPHYAKAVELRAEASSAFDSGDYDEAARLAKAAKAELALYGGAFAPLPASYTVRLVPEDRDCLSKIAGLSFIYNDSGRWRELYLANKDTLKHPEDEDLILPGEVLAVPSIAGERREGEYDPGKRYPDFKAD
jgi:nucleoid-associated protein YgaU